MALDFHQLDSKEVLFSLDDHQFEDLQEVFTEFKYQTGLVISQYNDLKLAYENQETLINTIDRFIQKSDLNKNKSKTSTILEFRTYLKIFLSKKETLHLVGD